MRDNNAEIDWHWVSDVSGLQGTVDWSVLLKAREYLVYQSWLKKILDEFIACKLGDGTYVFLFEIDSYKEDVDRFVWVICGNVPPLLTLARSSFASSMIVRSAPKFVS